MPVVESPYWDSWPASAPGNRPEGNFVLMKIDPVASVAIFEDEETTRAAAALERHEWVLGLVTDSPPGLPDANGNESLSLRIDLIGQGPPKDKPIASFPVAPSPQLYEDRPSIELQPRLPWPDLCLHTYYSSSVLISRIHHGPGYFQVALSEDEYDPIVSRAFDDRVDWHNLPPVTVEEHDAIPTVELAGSCAPDRSFHASDSIEDSSSSSEDEESLYAQQREDMGMKLLKARIFAEISLDPATCPGPLGSPADMEEPVTRIRELWASWQDRTTTEVLAKRPATNAWLQGVEAARQDSEGGFDIPDTEAPLDDMTVLPEDAVDERFGRGRSVDHRRRSSEPDPTLIVPSGPDPPSRLSTADPSTGPSARPLPHSASGDGDANPAASAPETQVPGTATGDPTPESAPSQMSAPTNAAETAASAIPVPSSQKGRISVIKRVLHLSRRVKPAVVRAQVGIKHMLSKRLKMQAST